MAEFVTMDEDRMWEKENIRSALSACGYHALTLKITAATSHRNTPNGTVAARTRPGSMVAVSYTAGLREKLPRSYKSHDISLISKPRTHSDEDYL